MTCYSPLKGFRGPFNKNGKQPLVFSRDVALAKSLAKEQVIPCGQCVGCRLKHSRCWAIRCIHEAQMHEENCFITLTYNNQNLPSDMGLVKRHFQLFMKRLRKKFGNGIRFFHSGEYGDKFGRPHYHAILFGLDFKDRVFLKNSPSGFSLYTSESLSNLWGKGYVSVADVSFNSAAYIARYVVKKINGKDSDEHYSSVDVSTGEVVVRSKEYATMSLKPAIGRSWFDEYKTSLYPRDSVVVKTLKGFKEFSIPRYYDKLYERFYGTEAFLCLKRNRLKDNKDFIECKAKQEDLYYSRLLVEEVVKMKDIEKLLRNLEDNVCS